MARNWLWVEFDQAYGWVQYTAGLVLKLAQG